MISGLFSKSKHQSRYIKAGVGVLGYLILGSWAYGGGGLVSHCVPQTCGGSSTALGVTVEMCILAVCTRERHPSYRESYTRISFFLITIVKLRSGLAIYILCIFLKRHNAILFNSFLN